MKNYNECPFEFLRRKNAPKGGEKFEEGIVSNWYKARAFVLDKLCGITIQPEEDAHLHVVIMGDDEMMLSLARQVALLAHFPNYDEEHPDETQRNRTLITVVSENEDVYKQLIQEEYLCNLLKFCKWSNRGEIKNKDSFIDVEFEIVDQWQKDEPNYKEIRIGKHTEKRLVFKGQDVESFCKERLKNEVFSVDTRKAQYANRMYTLGCEIDNLPYEDIHSVNRYAMALSVFQHVKLKDPIGCLVQKETWELEEFQNVVLTSLSNVFCSDCFMIRYNSIKPSWANGKMTEKQAWEKYCDALSKSEHGRWVVEKLILGYRPFSLQERLKDEYLVIDRSRRKQFRDGLKNNWRSPAHIDICPFSELRRIDPDSLKFDSFLVLGIPEILKKTKEINSKICNK